MSHWNHRVVRCALGSGEITYAIHEVDYSADGLEVPNIEEAVLCGLVFEPGYNDDDPDEALRDLREQLEKMLACLDKPIIRI